MPDSIIDDLLDLMATTITFEPLDDQAGSGKKSYGDPIEVEGRLSFGNELTRDLQGREVVSRCQFWAAGVFGLTTEGRYTLPSERAPTNPPAIRVDIIDDENGPHHEKVYF